MSDHHALPLSPEQIQETVTSVILGATIGARRVFGEEKDNVDDAVSRTLTIWWMQTPEKKIQLDNIEGWAYVVGKNTALRMLAEYERDRRFISLLRFRPMASTISSDEYNAFQEVLMIIQRILLLITREADAEIIHGILTHNCPFSRLDMSLKRKSGYSKLRWSRLFHRIEYELKKETRRNRLLKDTGPFDICAVLRKRELAKDLFYILDESASTKMSSKNG